MKWLSSILVGIVAAPLATIIVGTAANSWANWLRISPREGAAGYWVVLMALLGGLIALFVGISIARGWLLSTPNFWSALGTALGGITALTLVITAIIWLATDHPPRIDGRRLELAVEVRFPAGATIESLQAAPPYVTIMRVAAGDSRGSGYFDFKSAREVDGHVVVPITLDLSTSVKEKKLHVGFPEKNVFFPINVGSKPAPKDLEWTDWIVAETPETAFAARYKVVVEPPPAPVLTQEQQDAEIEAQKAAEMRALATDAPLAQWLVYMRYGVSQTRIDAAVAAIRARPNWVTEMAHEMLDGEYESSRDALRAVQHFKPPPAELVPGVAAVGDEIAATLLELEKTPPESDQYQAFVAGISTRFSAWNDATRALQEANVGDFTPQLKAIIEPARRLQDNHAIRIDVVRVASFYLNKWAGIAPLPTDPPPR